MKWLLSIAIVLLVALAFAPRAEIASHQRAVAQAAERATPTATPPLSPPLVFVPLDQLNPFPTIGAQNTTRVPTPQPAQARAHFPKPGAQNVSPDSLISMVFTARMQRASVESRFRVVRADNGALVNGYFEWRNRVMVFYPVPLLESDTTYQVRLKAGAETLAGTKLDGLEWNFSTGSLIRLPGTALP
jgi:hypothetical protein